MECLVGDLRSKNDQIICLLGAAFKYFTECLSEFRVKDGVDNRIEKGVDISKPCVEYENSDAGSKL